MQLAGLSLSNYRSCRETSVRFAPDLTVFVGENASGKTAIIDALRLVTFPSSGRQTAWFSADRDLSHGVSAGAPVDISARYSQLTDDEKGNFLAELVDAHNELVYTAAFATDADVPRRSILTWGVGDARLEDPEPALRRRIAHVYLPPLRDAVRDLDGGDQTLLHDVLHIIVGTDEDLKKEFVETANGALKQIAEHELAI